MRGAWTETLTILVRPDDLDETIGQVLSAASDLELVVNDLTVRQRRSWAMARLAVSLTGNADRISDFQELFAGSGWSALPEGSLLDPFINEGLQATHNWLRRKRRRRRAKRAQEGGLKA